MEVELGKIDMYRCKRIHLRGLLLDRQRSSKLVSVRLRHAQHSQLFAPFSDYRYQFLARDSIRCMLSRYAIASPSVRLSVCHTGGSVKNG